MKPFLLLMLSFSLPAVARDLPLDNIRLPPGFSISIYADNVPGARSMALGSNGTLFVGTRGEGKVYAVLDRNGDHRAEHAERRSVSW
jgi:hypothetical protein